LHLAGSAGADKRDFDFLPSNRGKSILTLQRSPVIHRSSAILIVLFLVARVGSACAEDKKPLASKKPRDGVYEVLRESLEEKDVLPLKEGEVLAMDRHPYLKAGEKEPPVYLAIRISPDVELALATPPKSVKDGDEVVRILLKLEPKSATALERLTTDRVGKKVAIVLGGEVVTVHKIREVIKGGEVQITSCAAGAAKYLLEQLQAGQEKK
jgi:hypothetical protein